MVVNIIGMYVSVSVTVCLSVLQLQSAAYGGDLAAVRALLADDKANINCQDEVRHQQAHTHAYIDTGV